VSRVRARSAGARPRVEPSAITEAELQRAVIDLARSLGWGTTLSARKALVAECAELNVEPPPLDGLIYHPRYSLGSEPGWPDLTLIRRRDRRLVFAELKAEKGRESTRQVEVLDLLRELDVELGRTPMPFQVPPRVQVFTWRPSDLASGAISEVLR
jgi:hypothetical protein